MLGSQSTPDSEFTTSMSASSSVARLRQSGSFESVEVLTSPSSVEVLGSTSSDQNKDRYANINFVCVCVWCVSKRGGGESLMKLFLNYCIKKHLF